VPSLRTRGARDDPYLLLAIAAANQSELIIHEQSYGLRNHLKNVKNFPSIRMLRSIAPRKLWRNFAQKTPNIAQKNSHSLMLIAAKPRFLTSIEKR